MSSEPAGMLRIRERLEKSWVVEGPITAKQKMLSVSAGGKPVGVGCTNFIVRGAHKTRCGLQPPSVTLSALLRNIIARAELYVRLFEIVSHPGHENQ